jgi:hypothetical protein
MAFLDRKQSLKNITLAVLIMIYHSIISTQSPTVSDDDLLKCQINFVSAWQGCMENEFMRIFVSGTSSGCVRGSDISF